MNGYTRTVAFVNGEGVDRPPFMPLVIDWAAKQQGADYRAFVEDPALRARVYIECADRFDIDCILPDADFYEQLADFGMSLAFKDGHFTGEPLIQDVEEDPAALPRPGFAPGTRMGNRLETLRRVAAEKKGEKYIFGICVGPFTEFSNARGTEDAMMDFLDDDEASMKWIRFFHENCKRFITAQLEAGADGIQLVEPCCSLINPALYHELLEPLHAELVALVQEKGGFARLHVCGDTNRLLPYTLATGTRILDVDYPVDMAAAAAQLSKGQVLCGNLEPVGLLLQGTPQAVAAAARRVQAETGGRAILSGGCDVPEDSPVENVLAMRLEEVGDV